jgi:hypothetical protein
MNKLEGGAKIIRDALPGAGEDVILRAQAMGAAIFDLIAPEDGESFADGGVAIGIALGKLLLHLSPDRGVQEKAISSIVKVAIAQADVEAYKARP